MSRQVAGVALVCGLMLVLVSGGCCFAPPSKPVTVAPPPPAPMPEPVVVQPAPPPVVVPPMPAPVVVQPGGPVEVNVSEPVTDTLADKIQSLSEKYPGLFKFDKNKGMLYFDSDITFDSGSAVVKQQPKAALSTLAEIMNTPEGKGRSMTVIGHTDADRVAKASTIEMLKKLGKTPDNMGLSKARAEAVAGVLETGGVAAGRLSTLGKGATDPVSDNRTAAGKSKNRRVEIWLGKGR